MANKTTLCPCCRPWWIRYQAKGGKYSVLGAITKAVVEHPEEDFSKPITIAVSNGADVDEVDPETEEPVAVAIAEAIAKVGKDKPVATNLISPMQIFVDHDVTVKKQEPKATGKEAAGGKPHKAIADFIDMKKSLSYLKIENKVAYVRALLNMAEYHSCIGKEAAVMLAKQASKGRGVTERKRTTIQRILTGRLPSHERHGDPIKVTITKAGKTLLEKFLNGEYCAE